MNENMEADEALVEEPKTIGATEAEDPDPPKGNPVVDVEPKMGDLVVCQL